MKSRNFSYRKNSIKKSKKYNNKKYLQKGGYKFNIFFELTGQRIPFQPKDDDKIYDLKKNIADSGHFDFPIDIRFNIILKKGELECLDSFDLARLYTDGETETDLTMTLKPMSEFQQIEKAREQLRPDNKRYVNHNENTDIIIDMLNKYTKEIYELKHIFESSANTESLPQNKLDRPGSTYVLVVPSHSAVIRYPLRVLPTDKIYDIKRAVERISGIPIGSMHFIMNGRELSPREDHTTISDYTIENSQILMRRASPPDNCYCKNFLCMACAENRIRTKAFQNREDISLSIDQFSRDLVSCQKELIHLTKVHSLLSVGVHERNREEDRQRALQNERERQRVSAAGPVPPARDPAPPAPGPAPPARVPAPPAPGPAPPARVPAPPARILSPEEQRQIDMDRELALRLMQGEEE
jgi:hypothetical protein